MKNTLRLFYALLILEGHSLWAQPDRGWVENPLGANQALIVGVAKNLPGIDIDVRNVNQMATHADYQFSAILLQNSQGTTSRISAELRKLSGQASADGTLMFYFSGHGNRGLIQVQDRTMRVSEIRSAIEKGRNGMGPLRRLILFFDSCYSGTLLDPFRNLLKPGSFDEKTESALLTEEVAREMTRPSRNGESRNYWEDLFVFAACRANETSLASGKGSIFTLAMKRAFEESMTQNLTMGEFVQKTQAYTQGHHPVARLVPVDLENEKMRP